MNTITLQDMPDDVLELIYSNLDIKDSVYTNVALHRKIIKAKIINICNIFSFIKIHESYHKYVNVVFNINLKYTERYNHFI